MKKFLALLLALLMLAPTLIACTNDEKPDGTSNDGSAADTTPTVSEDDGPALEVPAVTFDDADFNIFSASSGWTHYYAMAAEDIEGDIVSQAVYDRNSKVEDQFKVKLVYHEFDAWGTGIEARQEALNESATDSGLYDIFTANIASAARHFLTNTFVDIYEVDYLDLDKPWWYTEMNKSLDLNGHMLTATNHFCLQNIGLITALYFNKKMQEDNNIEDLYALVYDGEWTIDKFMQICEQVGKDLNNDNKYNMDDQYGLVAQNISTFALATGMGAKQIDMDENGDRYLVGGTDEIYKISEKIQTIVNASYFGSLNKLPVDQSDAGWAEGQRQLFTSDQTLFVLSGLNYATAEDIRNMESYGILPMPKLSAEQPDYISQTAPETLSIVANAGDMEMVGVITEALAYYSYKIVTPTYFEKSLGEKLARDPDTKEMLNIISSTLNCDFSYAYYPIFDTGLCFSIAQQPQLASWFAQNKTRYEKKLSDLMEDVEGLFED